MPIEGQGGAQHHGSAMFVSVKFVEAGANHQN
jgi:hypothetical protein